MRDMSREELWAVLNSLDKTIEDGSRIQLPKRGVLSARSLVRGELAALGTEVDLDERDHRARLAEDRGAWVRH